MSLNTLNKYALAIELLALNARISIVAKESGLSAAILRKAYVDMHHHSPASGPIRASPLFIWRSYQKYKEATLCAVFCRLENQQHGIRRVINGYRRYLSYIEATSKTTPLLDFSEAWRISTWMEAGVVKLVRCGYCRSARLTSSETKHTVCGVCRK